MTKLIGTNPNQVSSNADLGTAAFLDKKEVLLAKGSNLSAIETVIPTTAIAVFVYDTSNDSDGGAWRHRCQHLSWYNEPLNTRIRGSRREFPAVALIVVDEYDVYIYDADDPTLPMWMVFPYDEDVPAGQQIIHPSISRYWSSCHMVNAQLAVGMKVNTATGMGVDQVNFLMDRGWRYRTSGGSNYRGTFLGNIAQRRADVNYYTYDGRVLGTLLSGDILDLHMAVLDNDAIDETTKLPIPTVILGTHAGISIIREDGNVFNTAGGSYYVHKVRLTKEGRVTAIISDATSNNWVSVYANDYNDLNGFAYDTYSNWNSVGGLYYRTPYTDGALTYVGTQSNQMKDIAGDAIANSAGLTLTSKDLSSKNDENMVCHITDRYNTGWMQGDILISTLADTNAEDLIGGALITGNDSSFTSGTGNWIGISSTLSVNSGRLQLTGTAPTGYAYLNVTLYAGETYNLSGQIDFGNTFGAGFQIVNPSSSITTVVAVSRTVEGSGFYQGSYTATETGTHQIRLYHSVASGTGYTILYDSISIRRAEPDRSHNNKSIGVFGTIKKTPVRAGADIVGYSGFTSTDYLRQPYNPDLNFGSDQYSIAFWFRTNAGSGTPGFVAQMGPSDLDESLCVYISDAYGIYFDYGVGVQYASHNGNPQEIGIVMSQTWHHCVCHIHAGGRPRIYIDGRNTSITVVGVAPSTFTFDTDYQLNIGTGRGTDNAAPFQGDIALLRVSKSIPTAAQVKKMYDDEKHLFQENAKAVLANPGGSSTSDVRALAYDERTNLLYAGTGQGTNVFDKLQRKDFIKGVIGETISVSNGFMARD